MIRLALLSNWHVHAADYARDAAAHPGAELACVWDEDPERGRAAADSFGVRFEPDLRLVMADPRIDGVIVTSATAAHGRLMPEAARNRKHIFAEKVIAPTLRESIEIVDRISEAGVIAAIALTRAGQPSTRAALAAIAEGKVGAVTAVRVRLAHDGALPTAEHPTGWLPERFYRRAESNGGAMIDLGAHPLYLTRLLLGMPRAITAVYGDVTGRGVDDNAVALFAAENGAIGIAETGFVSRGGGFNFSVNGTAGSLMFRGTGNELTLLRADDTSEVLPVSHENEPPFSRWIRAIVEGTPLDANLTLALELSALVEASALSAESGKTVLLESLPGWDGLLARSRVTATGRLS